MKSERRHELHTNVLADRLAGYTGQLRPYSKQIVLALGAIIAVLAVATFLISDQSARLSSGWSDLFAASSEASPERLRAVADEHAGTAAGSWALLNEADIELARGMRLLYTDRASANDALERAIASYSSVVDSASQLGDLRLSARFGLAQALECRGETDDAIEQYDQIISEGGLEDSVAKQAQRRVELLKDPAMRRFYNWFANQKPSPPQNPGGLPNLGLPPDLPADLGQISDTPDFGIPTTDESPGDSDGTSDESPAANPDDSN